MTKTRAWALAALVAGGCAGSNSEILSPELRAIMDDPMYASSKWGLQVRDLATGELVYNRNPKDKFLTGSTAKIWSVTSALAALGADYKFVTPVYQLGTVTAGALDGDLVLQGVGDLTLGGRTKPDGTIDVPIFDHYDANILPGIATLTPEDPLAGLDALAKQVKAAGVTHVKGDVLVDDRLWDPVTLDHVPISPIVVNDNLIDFLVTPGAAAGQPVTFDWRPKTAAYTPDVQVTTGAAGSDIALELTADASGKLTLKGSVPAGVSPVVWTYQVADPATFARTLFIEALVRAGVAVDASPLGANPTAKLPAASALASASKVASFSSPPFSETARLINKVSHNLGANQLPLLLAAKNGQRTLDEGLALERNFALQAGIDGSLFVLSDGQGLPGCQVAPEAQTALLRYLSTRSDFSVFYDSTPILGVDGSLASVVPPDDPAVGHVHAKTGTLAAQNPDGSLVLQTKALAGYIDSAKGKRLVFAIYLNNLPITKVQDVLAANNALGKLASIIYRAQ